MVIALIAGALIVLFGFAAFFGAPYVPSHRQDVRHIFDHIRLDEHDGLVDIGSGDGLVLRIATGYGACAYGYEINPILWAVSKLLSVRYQGVNIALANFWLCPLPADATVIYAFSVKRDEKRLIMKLSREADRLGRRLTLICYGSPFAGRPSDDQSGAYHVYQFHPFTQKKHKV